LIISLSISLRWCSNRRAG